VPSLVEDVQARPADADASRVEGPGRSLVRQPGPLHAFYQRIRARRGHSVAVVAAARKLACLFWCLLTREEDYAYAQPSLTRKKLRRLELTAGHPLYTPEAAGVWHANDAVRQAERELAQQAELAYQRSVRDWHAAQANKDGRGRDTGTRIFRPSKRQAARQGVGPRPCALARRRPRPPILSQGATNKSSAHLIFIRRPKRERAECEQTPAPFPRQAGSLAMRRRGGPARSPARRRLPRCRSRGSSFMRMPAAVRLHGPAPTASR
jgi:hypothetical protein